MMRSRFWLLPVLLSATPAVAVDDPLKSYQQLTSVAPKRFNCSEAKAADEIVVCGRRRDNLRYRLPLKSSEPVVGSFGARSVAAERYALMQDRSEGGSGSCSAVGPNGVAGCMTLRWKMADEQSAGRTPGLISKVLTYLDPGE